jgi:hypothetical protein
MSVKKSTQNVIYMLPSGMLWIHSPTHIYRLIWYSDCNMHSCFTAFYWVRNVHAPPNLTIPIISHRISPCPTQYQHVLPYPTMSHHVPPSIITSYHIPPCLTMSHPVSSCSTLSCHVSPRPTINRHATTCPTIAYHIPPHIVMVNQALYHNKSHHALCPTMYYHASPNAIEPHHIQPILTMRHHILPCLTMSHHVPPCPTMSHNVSLCPTYIKVVLQVLTIYFRLTLLSMAYYNKIQEIFPKTVKKWNSRLVGSGRAIQCVQSTKLKKTWKYAEYCRILISQYCVYEDCGLGGYNAV